jgi:hypothetical protein
MKMARLSLNPLRNRWIRVTGLATILLGVSTVLMYRNARARTAEALSLLGEHVMQIPSGHYVNEVQEIEINGFQMMLQTAHADAAFDDVVTQFAQACILRGGMTDAEFGRVELDRMRAESRKESSRPNLLDGVLVEDTARGTVVACIDTKGVPWLSRDMLDRIKRFAKEGDLAALGTFRYALIKQKSYGAHFITMWSGASTPLLKMFPAQGDAPGPDHRFIPRLAGSRRVLSSSTANLQVVAYEYPGEKLNPVIERMEQAIQATGLQYKDLGGAPPGARFWVGNGDAQSMMMFTERDGRVLTTITDVP